MPNNIKAVDLFCGIGGLTKGLQSSGIEVTAGVDIDPACQYPFEYNCGAQFHQMKVEKLTEGFFENALKGAKHTLIAGCAPCQPFSTYQQKLGSEDSRWGLLRHFGNKIKKVRPTFVTMENVPGLADQDVFKSFVRALERLGYSVSWQSVDCSKYGVPQTRERLVLLASQLGPINLLPGRSKLKTVRECISNLPPIGRGVAHVNDKVHRSANLSDLNLKRIKASKPGGSWRDWKKSLIAKCHLKKTGKTYPGVYGRMEWDKPAPTLTTQFYGFGNGRFGHPDQDRALSIREGAILQTFPKNYRLLAPDDEFEYRKLGRLIGNAVPVKLGRAIGKSIIKHCESYQR